MFWIGLVVGSIVTIALICGLAAYCMKCTNLSMEEMGQMGRLTCIAGHNRECRVAVFNDNEYLDGFVLEET